MKKLNTEAQTLIHNRKVLRAQGIKEQNDLLDVMLEANESSEETMSNKEILDNIKTILFAGHDTTGAALSWYVNCVVTFILSQSPCRLTLLLSEHPLIEAKLLAEIKHHFPNSSSDTIIEPSLETLEKMEYLNACVSQ